VKAVVRNKWAPTVAFIVFDAPQVEGCWSKRIATVQQKIRCEFAAAVPLEKVNDLVHVAVMFRRIREGGGEASALRQAAADLYHTWLAALRQGSASSARTSPVIPYGLNSAHSRTASPGCGTWDNRGSPAK
jgi:hypothetical protein